MVLHGHSLGGARRNGDVEMTVFCEILRGVRDAERTADFFAWLLEIEPKYDGDRFRFECSNGALVIHGDPAVPVALVLGGSDEASEVADPDGVPVILDRTCQPDRQAAPARLDHIRLNCADLVETADFYAKLGFHITWSGRSDEELVGPQLRPLDRATWLHLSCDDGYVSISQADWQEYGRSSTASGPPRFIHIGVSVPSIDEVIGRLAAAHVRFLTGAPAVGRNLYLNDPEGVPALGTNIEIMEYLPRVARSGHRQVTPVAKVR
jgi:catechol 2,3-dioxygenase-like lactoylglutathione lyase family enzyme